MKYLVVWIALLLSTSMVSGQSESLEILDYDQYLSIVRDHHPLSKAADLNLIEGQAAIQRARGSFDPKAFADFDQKRFDEKEYYSLFDGGLKIPTWFGAAVQGGYVENSGEFLNPQDNVPNEGLWYAGISVPVGQGLILDKRRAELRKAQTFQKMTEMQQRLQLNELLYNAGKAYWDWFTSYNNTLVYEEALELAQERFQAVKQSAFFGDRPSIDTLEAGIQVQNRQLSLSQAELNFRNASQLLSVFLWKDGLIPLEPADNTVPITQDSLKQSLSNVILSATRDSLIADHPELRKLAFKIDQLNIEKRWQREQLKPEINFKYNFLSQPSTVNNDPTFNLDNYNWGLQFNFPIFLRQQRGQVRLADIKVREAQYDLLTKQASLLFKVNAALNEYRTTSSQIDLYNGTVKDYFGLLEGERNMFDAGESSLFMVNSRELGFINARLKLIELYSKNQKANLEAEFAFGLLN